MIRRKHSLIALAKDAKHLTKNERSVQTRDSRDTITYLQAMSGIRCTTSSSVGHDFLSSNSHRAGNLLFHRRGFFLFYIILPFYVCSI